MDNEAKHYELKLELTNHGTKSNLSNILKFRQMAKTSKCKSNDLQKYKKYYMRRDYLYGEVNLKYPISSIKLEKIIHNKPKKIELNTLIHDNQPKRREIKLSEILDRSNELIFVDNTNNLEKDDSVNIDRRNLRNIGEKRTNLTKQNDKTSDTNQMYNSSLKENEMSTYPSINSSCFKDFKKGKHNQNSFGQERNIYSGTLFKKTFLSRMNNNKNISEPKSLNKNTIESFNKMNVSKPIVSIIQFKDINFKEIKTTKQTR